MTEHSIAELERQYEAARSKSNEARRNEHAALTRLREAKGAALIAAFEARGGVVGKTPVIAISRWDNRPIRNEHFFVVGWDAPNWKASPEVEFKLAKIKKDGTPSAAPCGVSTTKVEIVSTEGATE